MRDSKGRFMAGITPHNKKPAAYKPCAYCGKEFEIDYRRAAKKYCTFQCWVETTKGQPKSAQMRAKLSAYGAKHCIGKKLSPERRARSAEVLRPYQSGEGHYAWKGGITPKQKRLRFTKRYATWRKSVFERDDYTCQGCGERGGKLNADHFPVSFRELFYKNDIEGLNNVQNGRTLCEVCHRQTPNYGALAWRHSNG